MWLYSICSYNHSNLSKVDWYRLSCKQGHEYWDHWNEIFYLKRMEERIIIPAMQSDVMVFVIFYSLSENVLKTEKTNRIESKWCFSPTFDLIMFERTNFFFTNLNQPKITLLINFLSFSNLLNSKMTRVIIQSIDFSNKINLIFLINSNRRVFFIWPIWNKKILEYNLHTISPWSSFILHFLLFHRAWQWIRCVSTKWSPRTSSYSFVEQLEE